MNSPAAGPEGVLVPFAPQPMQRRHKVKVDAPPQAENAAITRRGEPPRQRLSLPMAWEACASLCQRTRYGLLLLSMAMMLIPNCSGVLIGYSVRALVQGCCSFACCLAVEVKDIVVSAIKDLASFWRGFALEVANVLRETLTFRHARAANTK